MKNQRNHSSHAHTPKNILYRDVREVFNKEHISGIIRNTKNRVKEIHEMSSELHPVERHITHAAVIATAAIPVPGALAVGVIAGEKYIKLRVERKKKNSHKNKIS